MKKQFTISTLQSRQEVLPTQALGAVKGGNVTLSVTLERKLGVRVWEGVDIRNNMPRGADDKEALTASDSMLLQP